MSQINVSKNNDNYIQNSTKLITGDEISSLNQEPNEFSIFFSDIDKLRQSNNNKRIFDFLMKHYKTKDDEDEFINYFYKGNYESPSQFKAKEFVSVGIFEDLSYYPKWMNESKLEQAIKTLKEKFGIFYWHRTKGDGNCFYRSVIVSYFEIIISKSIKENKPELFFCLVKEVLFTQFPEQKQKFHQKTLTVLLFIYEEIQKHNEKAFDIFYRAINMSDSVEKSLILWFKIKLVLFLKQNLELEIAGIKLIQCIPGLDLDDEMNYDINQVLEYIDKKILKSNEYVEGYPLYITPFILKCNLDIYYLNNSEHTITQEKMIYHRDLMFVPVDSCLPFLDNDEENNISLLFKDPHYESLLTRERVNKIVDIYSNPDIILVEGIMNTKCYDKYKTEVLEYINTVNKKRSGNCFLDKKFTKTETLCVKCGKEMDFRLPCGCTVCFECSLAVINSTKGSVQLCKCNYVLNDSDIEMIINNQKR